MLLKTAILYISDSMFKRDRWEVRDLNTNISHHLTIQPFFIYLLALMIKFSLLFFIFLSRYILNWECLEKSTSSFPAGKNLLFQPSSFQVTIKEEILRTKVLRMTVKDWMMSIRGRITLFVILQPVKNLLNFIEFITRRIKE